MTPQHIDTIIVGQGLAGTAVAWTLKWRGQSVAVIDRNEPVTSSKVAAGLVTPITGKRLVLSWRFDEFHQYATTFYRRVEEATATRLFHERTMVRLFANESEMECFNLRLESDDFSKQASWLSQSFTRENDEGLKGKSERVPLTFPFRAELSGFEMPFAGQLDVGGYLSVSRAALIGEGRLFETDLDLSNDLKVEDDQVSVPKLGLRARRLVFCEGAAAMSNPWFPFVTFRPAKGEILTIRVPGLSERRIMHRGVWLSRVQGDVYRAGATYEWHHLDTIPTAAGRSEIESRLREFLLCPFEVIGHDAAVRPIHLNQYPVVGRHRDHPQLAILNGLGSKGTLQGPFMADVLAKLMLDGTAPPREVDLDARQKQAEPAPFATSTSHGSTAIAKRPPPLTEQAQEAIRLAIAPDGFVNCGDIGIDATAGNGHDTLFLSKLLGEEGQIVAIDIQPEALRRTKLLLAHRLHDGGPTAIPDSIHLVCDDHANLMSYIAPSDRTRVAAVMFNLGYLPSGDKSLVTRMVSTEKALRSAIALIRPGGIVTVIAYTGHPGGLEEATMVENVLADLPLAQFEVSSSRPVGSKPSPRLFIIRRRIVNGDFDTRAK